MHLTIKCDNPFILNDIVSYFLQLEGMGKGIDLSTYTKYRGSVAVLWKTIMRYRYGSSPAVSQLICRIPSVETFHTRITIFLTTLANDGIRVVQGKTSMEATLRVHLKASQEALLEKDRNALASLY